MITMTVKNEILRKSIHLFAIIFPVSYMVLTKRTLIVGLGIATVLTLGVEMLRFRWARFSRWFQGAVGSLLREHERTGLTGATTLIIGSFVTVLLFDRWIAMVALFFLVVSDAFGALVGSLWGKHSLFGEKTVEGCGVFLLTAVGIIFLLPDGHVLIGLTGVVVALLIDVLVERIDDNLTIPVGSAAAMQTLMWILDYGKI
jgi:dolichol kinase